MVEMQPAEILLSDFPLESAPLLDQLHACRLGAEPELCIEYARHFTTYLRDLADPQDPQLLKHAKAVRCFLTNKAPRFFDGNLLAGTTTSKRFGVPVHPERMGTTLWPDLGPSALQLTQDELKELDLKILPFWLGRSILEERRARFGHARTEDLLVHIVGFIGSQAGTGNSCGQVVLELGLERILQQTATKEAALRRAGREEAAEAIVFLRAVQEVLIGLIAYGANLGGFAALLAAGENDPVRRHQLHRMAEVCAQVPAGPARSFREAANSLWLLQIGLQAVSLDLAVHHSGLDQILYPWYRKDMASGALAGQEAVELVGCLWLKFNDNTSGPPEIVAELFGGSGEEAGNDLTHLMRRVRAGWNFRALSGDRTETGPDDQVPLTGGGPKGIAPEGPGTFLVLERLWAAIKSRRQDASVGNGPGQPPAGSPPNRAPSRG